MPRLTIVLALAALATPVLYAAPSFQPDVETKAKPWTSLDLNNNTGVFRFAITSDNAGGPRWGIFEEAVAKLNMLQPEFVMSIGDFIEGYEDDAQSLNKQWDRFVAARDNLEMPFFQVPGNHDHGRPLWSEVYNARFGKPYYHFVYKDVLFLCLATNTGPNHGTGISKEEVEYAKNTLDEHKDVRYTLVFQHKPLWNEDNPEWKQIQEALAGRPCTVFAGHTHNYLSQQKDGISFVTLATTGGGSALRGPAYGEFDHIAWVTMTKDGPRVANLMLDGIYDKDVRTADMAGELAAFKFDAVITAGPLRIDSPQFDSATSRLTLDNPASKPMRVKVLMETQPGVHVEPATVAAIVPPKGKREMDLRVLAGSPIPAPQVQPVVLHWTACYDPRDNTRGLEIDGRTLMPLDAHFKVAKAAAPPVIDGNVAEWGTLPFVVDQPVDIYTTPSAWKGPQDGSYRFGVSHDDQFLYVAVKTTDDEPQFDGWKYWEDFAIVLVDARATEKDDIRTAAFSLMAGPKLDPAQVEEYSMGKAPDGVQTASRPTADGLEAEFAIPLAYLNERQNGDWDHVRLNIGFSDFDRHDSRDGPTILYWRTQWERKPPFNSGLFSK